MKRLLLVLIAILVAAPASASEFAHFKKKPAAASGGAPTYLANESFDTNPGYDLPSWTAIGTPDPDNTTVVMEGTQSFYADGRAATAGARRGITASGEAWVYVLIRPLDTPTGTGDKTLIMVTATATTKGRVTIDNAAKISVYNGSTKATTVGVVSTTDNTHLWFHYKKGTGADGVADVGFSTTGTKPSTGDNFAAVSAGTATTDVDRIYIESEFINGSGIRVHFDKLRVDDATIGDNPS